MASLSAFLENELLDHILRNSAYTAPAIIYVGLFITDPTDADSGTEASGTNYARTSSTWDIAVAGTTRNSVAITFPTAGAGGWGTIGYLGVYDAVSGGNLLFHGAVAEGRVVGDTDTFQIDASDLVITLD